MPMSDHPQATPYIWARYLVGGASLVVDQRGVEVQTGGLAVIRREALIDHPDSFDFVASIHAEDTSKDALRSLPEPSEDEKAPEAPAKPAKARKR